MRLTQSVIARAFVEYGKHRKDWLEAIEEHIQMYLASERAFGMMGRPDEFEAVYRRFISGWQWTRGAKARSFREVLGLLRGLPPTARTLRLSTMQEKHWPVVMNAVVRVAFVKRTKEPSVMAISKLLHFWNPRMFVICDRTEVEQFVFSHRWLRSELPETRDTQSRFPGLAWYVRLLRFASSLVTDNPLILSEFRRFLLGSKGSREAVSVMGDNEATAAEWCLIGLAEMPPAGVVIS